MCLVIRVISLLFASIYFIHILVPPPFKKASAELIGSLSVCVWMCLNANLMSQKRDYASLEEGVGEGGS